MRTAFMPYVFAAAAAGIPLTDTMACTKQAVASRVRADVIFDLHSGQKIYTNLSDADMTGKALDPASLTKYEGAKEILRRVWSGLWDKDTKFPVSIQPQGPVHERSVDEVIRLSMVTSFNVMDQIASRDPSFMEGIQASLKNLGMASTRYVSPTGNPDASLEVRRHHRTTVGDLMISIRDYHLNYAPSDKVMRTFGRPSLSGLPSVEDIPHLDRSFSTVTLLETAISKKAQPVPGVSDGKTAYSCAAGFGVSLKYDFNGRSFIVMTLGHDKAAQRDAHARHLIETHKDSMAAFVPVQEPIPATALK